tara:strand:+ start:85 stop:642 length:558 start_codon:yes stop_codon:yes gene_type:complete
LRDLKNELGDQLSINWRSFLLEQVNNKNGDDWKAWEQSSDYISRGIWPLRGGIASSYISEDYRDIFSNAIMEKKHVDRHDVRSREYVIDLAVECGMNKNEFSKYLDSDQTMDSIIQDHLFAEKLGIFGTPTFYSDTLGVLFVKMFTPPKEESVEVFNHLLGVSENKKYLGEIKRPQPPWPRGAID